MEIYQNDKSDFWVVRLILEICVTLRMKLFLYHFLHDRILKALEFKVLKLFWNQMKKIFKDVSNLSSLL